MSSSSVDNEIPQWKKDLIARLRSQNRRTATAVGRQEQQLCTGPPQRTSAPVGRSVQQPSLTRSGPSEAVAASSRECAVEKCNVLPSSRAMVQERAWGWSSLDSAEEPCRNGKGSDSDSSEDLRYGPGIVNKLRNKYLSLAQRESQVRASILPMRKAASLENILDDDVAGGAAPGGNRLFQTRLNGSNDTAKNVPNRYRNAARGADLKRARSVEAISSSEDHDLHLEVARPKRESLHEEMLIAAKEGSDKPTKIVADNKMLETAPEKPYSHRINRPKRITPIMNEKEKPPVDVVKQAKLIFERRPEQRTKPPQQTGDVAAKVASYKSIIVLAKAAKKPPLKIKPVGLSSDKPKTNGLRLNRTKTNQPEPLKEIEVATPKSPEKSPSLPSPIPDVSRIDIKTPGGEYSLKATSLSETPDLIMTSSPLPAVNSPSFRIAATENFIKEEKRLSGLTESGNDRLRSSIKPVVEDADETTVKKISPINANASNTMTFNFAKTNNCLPTNRNALNTQTPQLQPLKVEINGVNNVETKKSPRADNDIPSPRSPVPAGTPLGGAKPNLTILEIEKNLINTAKTLEQPKIGVSIASVEEVTKIKVPKVKKPPRELENNSIVFKFTDRKDVPDYVHNDGTTRVTKIEKPKVGEGGIILLPGASIDESFTDEDEEIMRSLECPPSPCNVTFINDNILIDGRSSLSQKTKKAKMKISFVEAGPEIFEYPSESSLLIEDAPGAPLTAQIRHSVPSITGSSSLGNYTPKSTEEFQPGVTRSVQNIPTKSENPESIDSPNELILQEVEKPFKI
ncbi:uncharacterized protein BDFB_000906 [Asbolus verrucosus]|uniref:Uncharacterized protein n=1 Tax=Asbolus verrucosus TaxID=1661398 RepID=A0A482VPF7_ASBVE|nr:uncharacterized protein BDFB_000906 [Asbolus verrucosus]